MKFSQRTEGAFKTLEVEMLAYFNVGYAPIDVGSKWHNKGYFSDEVTFTILLPGFDDESSRCDFTLDAYSRNGISKDEEANRFIAVKSNVKVDAVLQKKEEGMILVVNHDWGDAGINSCRLNVEYWPDMTADGESINQRFYLDD